MTDSKFMADNCKPRSIDFVRERKDELRESLNEPLVFAPYQRKMSCNPVLQVIKQFSFLIKDYNTLIEPEND